MPEFLSGFLNSPYVLIVLLTFTPALELRASIPYGILVAGLPWFVVVPLAIVVNILLGPVVYFLLDKFLHLLLRIHFMNRMWDRMIVKVQRKIHPLVQKYGVVGLGVFIGIPLPGSGVYTGAAGGYLLGFTRREFYVATVMGVLIAGTVVTAVVLTGSTAFDLFIRKG